MRVIVIEEKDIRALVDKLELDKLKINPHIGQSTVDQIHRKFHYTVVNWAHEQGSSYPN